MTEEEGDSWIALALLHGPSTVADVDPPGGAPHGRVGSHDPINYSPPGEWWVYRAVACAPSFATRAEASRHYCIHYGIAP